MNGTITPASLRAHADWMDGDDGQAWEGSRALRLRADRLEAESARDELVEKLSKLYWEQYMADDTELDRYRFDRLCGDTQRVVKAGIRAVLDRLAADGRLLPEGGTDWQARPCSASERPVKVKTGLTLTFRLLCLSRTAGAA